MWLTVSTLSNILILKGQYLHTTLNAFFFHFASYCEFTTKKEQDNGCNRSSKNVNLKFSDLTLCWKRTHQEHSSFTSTSLGFFWEETTNGSKRAVSSKPINAKRSTFKIGFEK